MIEINKHREAERKTKTEYDRDIRVQNVRQDSSNPSSSCMEANTGVTMQPGR
jgi:hypothetical protein